jgi:hypothetical protein
MPKLTDDLFLKGKRMLRQEQNIFLTAMQNLKKAALREDNLLNFNIR